MMFGWAVFLYLLALVPLTIASENQEKQAPEWSYAGDTGPARWPDLFPLCGGQFQSPIDITRDESEFSSRLTAFNFHGYDTVPEGARYTLINNGHSAQIVVDMEGDEVISISGAGLKVTYNLAQIHFHWGSQKDQGSEHTLEGKRYPMEMHMVHYSSAYPTMSDAADKTRGLAVLGFLVKIGNENVYFNSFVQKLKQILNPGDETRVKAFALKDLLPEDVTSYWRYSGSLTTPACDQSVEWTVFHNPIVISRRQLELFRGLYSDHHNVTLADNYRPTQPLNGRTVYTSSVDFRLMRYLRDYMRVW